MKYLLKSLTLIAVMSLMSCGTESTEILDKIALTKEVEVRFGAFVNHMNSLETEQLKDFYSDDPRFYWVEDGQVQYANKTTLSASLEGLVGSLKSSDMKVLGTKVEVFGNESAMIYAEYEQAVMMESGFGFDINGAMTVLLQKEAGIWRFLIGHSSTKKQRGE